MEETINRLYEFLLADPDQDPDYTTGNTVAGNQVYLSALGMRRVFSELFEREALPSPSSLFNAAGTWHVRNCTVIYSSRGDRELPNNPRCFGYLRVVGNKERVEEVGSRLTERFPGIDALVTDTEY